MNENREREIVEVFFFFITNAGEKCVSIPSIFLLDMELSYLDGFISDCRYVVGLWPVIVLVNDSNDIFTVFFF